MNILIIGGNRFFGKRLAKKLVQKGWNITLLNRGNSDDGLGNQVKRIICDRTDAISLKNAVKGMSWDLVYDQICYDYKEAKEACDIFNGKTKKYIFTSSQSVYEDGENLIEEDFQSSSYHLKDFATKTNDYSEAKKQAELSFEKYAQFPVTYIRFPIVIGPDDYTERFKFHVDRIKKELPIYIPNLNARISFITSDFAAETLAFLADKKFSGAINAASPSPIKLRRLLAIIEEKLGKKVILADQEIPEGNSPYGLKNDWFMNCKKLESLGLKSSEIEQWLPGLL